jgi:hypothetical protein
VREIMFVVLLPSEATPVFFEALWRNSSFLRNSLCWCSGSAQQLGLCLRTLTGSVTIAAISKVDGRHSYRVEIYSRNFNHVSSYYIYVFLCENYVCYLLC